MVTFLLSTFSSPMAAFVQSKHYGLRLVPRVHRPRSLNFEHEHRKRMAKSRPASSLNLCPSYSRAESGDSFLCPESGVCTEVNTVLVQLSYLNRPIDDVRKCSPNHNNYCLWDPLPLYFSRIELFQNYSSIRDSGLHGLPKDLLGEVRGQPAHDSLETF